MYSDNFKFLIREIKNASSAQPRLHARTKNMRRQLLIPESQSASQVEFPSRNYHEAPSRIKMSRRVR